MEQEQFLVEVKRLICHADWHWRYYTIRANKFHWRDVWIKGPLGIIGVIGAVVAGSGQFPLTGAFLAGACAFILGTVLPNFKWDVIVSGLKDEEQEWAAILLGFQRVYDIATLFSKTEILAQEFQKAKALQEASKQNNRHLPEDLNLRNKIEAEVRKFYNLDPKTTKE